MISKQVQSEIEAAGFRMKTFQAVHLEEARSDIETLAAQGLVDHGFYQQNLTSFNYDYSTKLENVKSVILVAAPQCKSLIEFKHKGKTLEAVIPPTYVYPNISDKIMDILNNSLVKNGFNFVRAILPLKLLAARCGLGSYGRNNIFYASQLGSFVRLAAFATDYEFQEDSWGSPKVMESCSSCTACIDACPTGAIDKSRFVIHAENCITNFNEYEAPIPEWIKPEWHDSIVGCMKCQAACPHNKKLLDLVESRISFNEEESELILGSKAFESLPLETRNKISAAGMEFYYNVLPRNIRLLMDK